MSINFKKLEKEQLKRLKKVQGRKQTNSKEIEVVDDFHRRPLAFENQVTDLWQD